MQVPQTSAPLSRIQPLAIQFKKKNLLPDLFPYYIITLYFVRKTSVIYDISSQTSISKQELFLIEFFFKTFKQVKSEIVTISCKQTQVRNYNYNELKTTQ